MRTIVFALSLFAFLAPTAAVAHQCPITHPDCHYIHCGPMGCPK